MKYSCKTDETIFQSQDTIFLIIDTKQIEILQINGRVCLRIKCEVPAPGPGQDPPGSFIHFGKTRENLSILSIAFIEIFNGINGSPLLTFVMLFNKLVISSIKSTLAIAN